MPVVRAGAMPEDWNTAVWALDITEDLLPVVSNTDAEISPQSGMKSLGKTPSQYNGRRQAAGFTGWTQHVATLADVERWQAEPDYGMSIICRQVRAIDVDVPDPVQAQAIREFLDARFNLPTRVRGNSSKFLQVFRLEGELPKQSFKTALGLVEFLATKQQFIACGTHTSGARYEWEGGFPSDIPTLTQEEFDALWVDLHTQFGVEAVTESKVSTRHEVLDNAIVVDPIAQYLIAQHIVRGIGADKKMNITCPWVENHSMGSGDTETVYYPAHTNGHAHGAFKCLHAGCEKKSQQDFLDAVGYQAPNPFDDIVDDTPAAEGGEASKPNLKFVGEWAVDFCNKPDPGWIVKGVLPEGDLAFVYGEPGSGKSFFILDMCAALARGTNWRDRKVKKSRIAYVCAEGVGGFRKRLKAYAFANDIDLGDLPIAVFSLPPKLQDASDASALANGILAMGGADIVIFDTLSQCAAGVNENSGEDMGQVLANCKGIGRKLGGAMSILVHHSGKDSSKGMRGWSGNLGGADAVIEVVRSGEYRAAIVAKQKDGEDGAEFGFKLTQVLLYMDGDGDEVTSCVMEHSAASRPERIKAASGPKYSDHQALAIRMLKGADFDPDSGVKVVDLIAAMLTQSIPHDDPKKDRRQGIFKRSIEALIARGDFELTDGRLKIKGDTNE